MNLGSHELSQHDITNSMLALSVGGVAGWVVSERQQRQQERVQRERSATLLPYAKSISEAVADSGLVVISLAGLAIDIYNPDSYPKGPSFNPVESIITAPPNFAPPLRRANGTVRDFDLFAYHRSASGSYQAIDAAEQIELKQTLKTAVTKTAKEEKVTPPVISVATFDNATSLFHSATMLSADGRVIMRQGNASVNLPADALEPWTLNLPDGTALPVLNPWEQYWRSVVRFCSGEKPKDSQKLAHMRDSLRANPAMVEIEDGALALAYSQFNQKMLEGNSWSAFRKELSQASSGVVHAGTLALARTVMAEGQRHPLIERIVQGTPTVFDHFVGVT